MHSFFQVLSGLQQQQRSTCHFRVSALGILIAMTVAATIGSRDSRLPSFGGYPLFALLSRAACTFPPRR